MSIEWQWIRSSAVVEEPFDNTASVSYSFTLKNIGTTTAKNVGFYLKEASLEGAVDEPSTDGIIADWYDVLKNGEAAGSPVPGFKITQGVATTRFNFTDGHSFDSAIPLTLGSGASSNEVASGAEVELTFIYIPESGAPTRRLYVEVEVAYTEE